MIKPDEDVVAVPYQKSVESLLYLVQGTKPDLAFGVSNVSRFNSNYGADHWTVDYRIKYKFANEEINGFVDAD